MENCVMIFTAVITPDSDGGFVALNPETGSTSQGESAVEALTNLKEATKLYLEEFPMKPVAQSWMTTFEVACA
jgi:predicted RNase H-like HicB family nuclease